MKSGLVDNAPPQHSNGLKPRRHHNDPPENGVGVVDHSANGNGARCDDRPAAYVANNRDAIYRWQSFDYDRVPPIDWEHYGQVTFMLLGCFSGEFKFLALQENTRVCNVSEKLLSARFLHT